MQRFRLTMFRAAAATALFVAAWAALTLTIGGIGIVDLAGWCLVYLMGLAWVEFLVEQAACRIETRRVLAQLNHISAPAATQAEDLPRRRGWNPLDPTAWYYRFGIGIACCFTFAFVALVYAIGSAGLLGPRISSALTPEMKLAAVAAGVLAMAALAAAVAQSQRLRQSLAMLAGYSILFGLVYLLIHWQFNKGGDNEYELPAGGGTDSIKASSVKVQKVIRKKYVINPYSSIIFAAPPPIDQVDVKLDAETANQYKAGQGDGGLGDGEGEGGGFGGGTGKGKIRFIRLRHSDKSWDKNFGIGGDRNLLAEWVAREPKSRGKIADETESIDIAMLGNFPAKKSPPLVYVGGAHNFAPSAADKKVLKQYLTERHGMILGDNLGGQGFHNEFIAVMNEVTGVTPVDIPRDDRIHQRPFNLPQFPFVVAHARPIPLGWKIDGRWAVYYHPGALSDAWRDDHAGIKKEIYDLCYQLGINIVYYAHKEYGRWLVSQQP